jgi:hypothetical protein
MPHVKEEDEVTEETVLPSANLNSAKRQNKTFLSFITGISEMLIYVDEDANFCIF